MELAIDTSTDIASLALAHQGKLRMELTWHSEQNHTVELLPNLVYMLKQTGIDITSLEAIVVARGPGSYNGLRVGISTAKGLAFALSIPLIGIGTLEVEAFPHSSAGLPVCPISNAGRGEIAAALYQREGEQLRCLVAEHISTLEALCDKITQRTIFCGEIVPALSGEIQERLGDKAILATASASLRRAGYLAELGWQRLKFGKTDDPNTLQPIYLRHPAITVAKPIH